ncbi:SRPBCC family protein [Chryseolinea sp. T2]|uniref:SRPBCC family protein n=1 Tax=Chryseolinea sp. T2 TaxID=3129255 RepID=UPI003076B94D
MITTNETKIVAKPGHQDLFIEREFEAPRDLVFRAFSEPDLLVQWLGPDNLTMEIDKFDNRSGGSYRFVHIDERGNRYGFNGAIHEVAPPERVIRTFEFEGLPERGHVAMEIALFEVLPHERTRLKIQSIFKSVEDRDGMIASGMERGMNQSYAKLDELLKK